MKGYKREDRVAELLLEEISSIVIREVKDPRVNGVTITHVKVSADLQHAKVFYINSLGDQFEAGEGLKHSAGYIRYELKKRLRLRYIPQLTFIYDDSFDYGERIDKILKEIESEDEEH